MLFRSPGVLKPDIIAPGVDILAAYVPLKRIKVGNYDLVADYKLMSGTSMATPHVAGVESSPSRVEPSSYPIGYDDHGLCHGQYWQIS